MDYFIIIIITVAVVLIAVVLYNITRKKQSTDATQGIERKLFETQNTILQQLNAITKEVNNRLRENSQAVQETSRAVGDRLDATARSYTAVSDKLTKLEEANKKIYDVGKDIASLQEILRSPKMRGAIGELFLGNLLSQILPPEHYIEQHHFNSGEIVDAVIKLRDNMLVPVDSKFPLENFQKMLAAEDAEKITFQKLFISDVKKHIDKIAKQYILPDEGTLNIALMYIPAENVYYETIVKGAGENDLINYAHSHNVIPVSPNSFYVYLQTILLGLRGMQIETSAREMMQNLSRLKGDLERFMNDYTLVGKHLGNAGRAFDDSRKRLEKVETKFERLAHVELAELPEPEVKETAE